MNKRKLKILIADDSAMNRELLCEMLDGEYTIDQACNGREAIAKLDGSADDYSLMLLDIVMPEIDGYGVLAQMNNRGWINRVPVIMISSDYRGESVSRAYSLGAADFINRPFDALTVSHRVANTIKLHARQRAMESMVADKVAENSRKSDLMTAILSHIVEFRNGESGPHVLNIKVITTLLLRDNSVLDVELSAERLANIERTIDVNINAQKTPVLITCEDNQRLTLQNLYKNYEGNMPVIYGDKNINPNSLKVLTTGAPYVSDRLYEIKTQTWNEILTYLGVSNVNVIKKERLISDEVKRNQGGIIASRYSRLVARQEACEEINKMFGLNLSCEYREDFQELDNNGELISETSGTDKEETADE